MRTLRIMPFGYAIALPMLLSASDAVARAPSPPQSVSDLYLITDGQSRSISPENRTGAKGDGSRVKLENGSAREAARELGDGWKVNPFINIKPGERVVLGEADGPGIINHIWLTTGGDGTYRSLILRMYWDDEATPSVEVPVGDFFASAFGKDATSLINSAVIAVNPESGLNSFWQMPFRRKFRIELENRSTSTDQIYYQIDYSLTNVPAKAGYFHAQFRMVDRLKPKEIYTLLDGVKGPGQYVGTYITHSSFSAGWWGEGEFKFYIDGDGGYPTINTTGEEDYFLGSYSYRYRQADGKLAEQPFSSAYAGFYTFNKTDNIADYFREGRERRIAEYRWHVFDPIRFRSGLRLTLQSIGWKSPTRYRALDDGYSSVSYWYQAEPHAAFPALPGDAALVFKPLVVPAAKP
jgi:hypothetical protein